MSTVVSVNPYALLDVSNDTKKLKNKSLNDNKITKTSKDNSKSQNGTAKKVLTVNNSQNLKKKQQKRVPNSKNNVKMSENHTDINSSTTQNQYKKSPAKMRNRKKLQSEKFQTNDGNTPSIENKIDSNTRNSNQVNRGDGKTRGMRGSGRGKFRNNYRRNAQNANRTAQQTNNTDLDSTTTTTDNEQKEDKNLDSSPENLAQESEAAQTNTNENSNQHDTNTIEEILPELDYDEYIHRLNLNRVEDDCNRVLRQVDVSEFEQGTTLFTRADNSQDPLYSQPIKHHHNQKKNRKNTRVSNTQSQLFFDYGFRITDKPPGFDNRNGYNFRNRGFNGKERRFRGYRQQAQTQRRGNREGKNNVQYQSKDQNDVSSSSKTNFSAEDHQSFPDLS